MSNLLMLSTDELRSRRESLRAELAPIAERSDLTPELSNRFDSLTDSLEQIDAELERRESDRAGWLAEKAAAVRSGIRNGSVRTEAGAHTGPEVMVKGDPFDLDEHSYRSESTEALAGRARTAIERIHDVPDSGRAMLDRLLKVGSVESRRQAALYSVVAGSDAYRSAFAKWLLDPWNSAFDMDRDEQRAFALAREFQRAAQTLTTGAGLVPQQLDPTIVLTSNGSSNPFRQIARVEQGFTSQWEGVNSDSISAAYYAEGAQVTDDTEAVTAVTIPAQRGAAYAFGSMEVVGDTNWVDQLPRLFQDAKDNLEAEKFVTGAGSGSNEPYGIVTELLANSTASVVNASTATEFNIEDVYALHEAVPSRHRGRASWVANQKILNKIRRFGEGTSGSHSAFWADLGQDVPATLLGRPVYEASAMDSTNGADDEPLLFGNFQNAVVYDRLGMQVVVDHVQGANQRPTGQWGYTMYFRSGFGTTTVNAFRLLQT